MDMVRVVIDVAGQFGRRVFCWVSLGGVRSKAGQASTDDEDLYPYLDQEEEDECPICTEPLSQGDPLHLPCNHVFHSDCLRRWACVKLTCPLDRRPIPPEALIGLNTVNVTRLHVSVFLESMLASASMTIVLTHMWLDFPINLLAMAITKCGKAWVNRIDRSLYQLPITPAGFQAWTRSGVRMLSHTTFHLLLWTSCAYIGYARLVLHYLIRQTLVTHGHWLFQRAIELANVGYDYQAAKSLLASKQSLRTAKAFGFVVGVLVGRQSRVWLNRVTATLLCHFYSSLR